MESGGTTALWPSGKLVDVSVFYIVFYFRLLSSLYDIETSCLSDLSFHYHYVNPKTLEVVWLSLSGN